MWADNETTQDLLGYQVHADLLKKIILADEMLPISIGVFGNWGSGKSSLMLLLHDGIKEWKEANPACNILQIQFNSWQFEDFDSTKLTVVETILDSLKRDIAYRTDLGEKIDVFFQKIDFLKAGVFVLKKAFENLTPNRIKKWLPSKDDIDKITGDKEYNELFNEVSSGNSSKFIAKFRLIFEKLIEETEYKAIIVYIDDLDRCAPERIIDCLEAVKLFVNVKNTAFVIGADERIIEYAIKTHYPIEQEKEEISSPFSDYLEKLIQLPYKIPKLSDNEQETYITLLLCKNTLDKNTFDNVHKKYVEFRRRDKHSKYNIENIKSNNIGIDFSSVEYMLTIVPIMKQFLNGNPRQLKRFLNTLYVRKGLANVAGFDNIQPDILVKLMVLEYNTKYATRFEDLYKIQRDNDGILPITEAEEEAKSEGSIQDARWKDNWSSEYLTKWIASKPSLVNVNLQDYFWVARDALKNEKPIASFVTSKVSLIFKNLCSIQLDRAMKIQLPAILNSLDEEELNMLLHLLNDRLRKNPDSQICWRILNCDENNILISNNLECIKQLFAGVDTYHIDPQASATFSRLLNIKGEIHDYVKGIKKSTALINTLKRKNK